MFFLATFLSWGWPAVRIEYGPAKAHAGMSEVRINKCCGSMLPYLRGGELAYVSPLGKDEKAEGLVVSTDDRTHWVTAETKDAVLTSGTANRGSDGWTPKSKVRFVIRYIVR